MASVNLSGTWKLESSENMDAFLKVCGVGLIHRTMASRVNPTVCIKQTGMDLFDIATTTSLSVQKMSFKLNQIFRGNIPWERNDRDMVASWEGDRLVIRMVGGADGTEPVFTRYLSGDQLVLMQSLKGVEAKRYFQRVMDSE